MSEARIGKLPPRYSFILNPYVDFRASKCPNCSRVTHMRKFALFLTVKGFGPMALRKTCRYCSSCELIVAHKDEMDAELAICLSHLDKKVVGHDYFVSGTLDLKVWKASIDGPLTGIADTLQHVADFKQSMSLMRTGGWGPE